MESIDTPLIKHQILEASKSVFRDLGYVKVKMEDIAKAAGMGRSSIYYYYKNKLEVFEAVTISVVAVVIKTAVKKTSGKKTFFKNFLQYNAVKMKLLNIEINSYKHLVRDILQNPDILINVKKETTVMECNIMSELLRWGMLNKEIKPMSEEELRSLSGSIVQVCHGMEQEMFLFGKVENMDARLTWFAQILGKALG